MNKRFSLDKVKENQAKVARHLLTRDDELRRAQPVAALLESRTRSELPLAAIQDRLAGDARPCAPEHVVQLAESIVRLGLITPITVDGAQRLIAGGHRRAALGVLALSGEARAQAFAALVAAYASASPRQRPDAAAIAALGTRLQALPVWQGLVPVYVMAIDAATDPDLALRIEVAENEHRKQYTRHQVLDLARRLRASGFKDTPGRPAAGERALRPELIAVFGISRATVARYLAAPERTPVVGLPSERFTRLRRELRLALPLMSGPVAETAQQLEQQLAAVVELRAAARQAAEQRTPPVTGSLPTESLDAAGPVVPPAP